MASSLPTNRSSSKQKPRLRAASPRGRDFQVVIIKRLHAPVTGRTPLSMATRNAGKVAADKQLHKKSNKAKAFDANITAVLAPRAWGELMPAGILSRPSTIWYPFLLARPGDPLRGALFSREQAGASDFAIRMETAPLDSFQSDKPRMLFARFQTPLAFYAWLQEAVPKALRCCHEIIRGNARQKPYFDIDMPVSETAGASCETIEAAVQELAARAQIVSGVDAARFMIFSSNSEAKYSFHIVLTGVSLASHKEAREFCRVTLEAARAARVHASVLAHVDMGLYSAMQQFRIVGCQKYGTGRVKIFRADLSDWVVPEESRQPDVKIFADSLVSNVSGCLPPDARSEIARVLEDKARAARIASATQFPRPEGATDFLSAGEAEAALAALCAELQRLGAPTTPFRLRDDMSGYECGADAATGAWSCLVPLNRESASHCPPCGREHEAENPYMIVWPARGNSRAAFCCRRNESKVTVRVPALDGFGQDPMPASSRLTTEALASLAPPKLMNISQQQQPVSQDIYCPPTPVSKSCATVFPLLFPPAQQQKPKPRPKRASRPKALPQVIPPMWDVIVAAKT